MQSLEVSENTSFIDFGQIFHKLWQYKWNLTFLAWTTTKYGHTT